MTTFMKKNHARSGPAIWFRVRTDLRGRRLPAGSVILVVALATTLIGLALAVFGSAQAPFDRLFTQLNDKYAHDPALNGVFSDVYVYPALYDPHATQRLLASRPEVDYYYSTYSREGQLSDGNTLDVLFTGGDTRRITATVSTGRWFNAGANELVVSMYALQHFGLHLGERVPLVFHLGELNEGQQVTIAYTIVGTLYMTQRPEQGYAPLSSLTAHAVPDQLLANTGYEVTLRQGVSPQAFERALQTATSERIGVQVYDLTLPGGIEQGPLIMLFLSIALMIVAGVGMLNAMVLSTRERYRELASLKAIGFTPRQVLGSVINGALALGILAILIGIPLGLWLNTLVAQVLSNSVGGPPNIQIGVNWLGLALLIPATAMVAVLGAYVPARWAARIPAAEILRYE